MCRMVLFGAGGHARVVYESLKTAGVEIDGIFDHNSEIKTFAGLPVVHAYSSQEFLNQRVIIAIGNNEARARLAEIIKHEYGRCIDRTALIAPSTKISQGSMVLLGAAVQSNVLIDEHAIVNTRAIVEHDCHIGKFAHIGPAAVICGAVKVGVGAFIGANSTVLPGIEIGDWATVGAGSVVLEDVKLGTAVAGNPARIL